MVTELYIDIPETIGMIDMLIATPAGNAKIDLAIYSPRDESVLGLFLDKRSTAKPQGLPDTRPRTVNRRAFNRLFNDWAEDITESLNR